MKRTTEQLCLVAGLAILARALVVAWGASRVPPSADGSFYHVVAQRIAAGEGYTWLWPDGAVTHAAHYPVGYPALVGGLYAIFGAHPVAAMMLNLVFGALGALAAYTLSRDLLARTFGAEGVQLERGALAGGLVVALLPTLVLYTPALMTELAVGSVVLVAADCARRARSSSGPGAVTWLVLTGLVVGAATLLRPQCIVLAPLLGLLAEARSAPRALGAALLASVLALGVTAPWIARNCDKMGVCSFVSANGGWNLLIGTYEEGRGAWIPIEAERVPSACREVFAEAEKDVCFRRAAEERIRGAPLAWIALAPAKLRVTFDYTGAAAEHLRQSGAIGDQTRLIVGGIEIVTQRLCFLLALLAAASAERRCRPAHVTRARRVGALLLVLLGALGFGGLGAAWGWFAVLGLLVPVLWRSAHAGDVPVGLGLAVGGVASTALVHVVFFGAGRYLVPVLFWVAPLVAAGVFELSRRVRSNA